MPKAVQVVTRPVRQITIKTGRPWSEFRAAYERAVPHFDRLEAIGVRLLSVQRPWPRGIATASAAC